MIRLYQIYPYGRHQISEKLLEDLGKNEHPYAKFSTYPPRIGGSFFEEHLFVFNFMDVADKYSEITGNPDFNIADVSSETMQSLQRVREKEAFERRGLERLALKIVKEYFTIEDDEIEFDIQISDRVKIEVMNGMAEEPEPMDYELTDEIKKEIEKRKIINSIQQGSALKTSRIYQMYDENINAIDGQLMSDYKSLIESAYLTYYLTYPQDLIMSNKALRENMPPLPPVNEEDEEEMSEFEMPLFGGVFHIKYDEVTNKPIVYARGNCFPILLHEMIKGVMEILSFPSIPEDEELAKIVINECDTLLSEHYGIILSPKMWEKFNNLIPYEKQHLRSLIFSRIFSLPTDEFLELMSGVFKNIYNEIDEENDEPVLYVNEIISELETEIYNFNNEYDYHYEENEEGGDDDISNDDILDNLLS